MFGSLQAVCLQSEREKLLMGLSNVTLYPCLLVRNSVVMYDKV